MVELFSALMFFVAVPVALVPVASGHRDLLIVAFLLGMAGSSFAVGVGYVSRWFSMERQGSALGVYGLGNIGQSAAVFLGPVVAAAYGFRTVYWGMSVILLAWAVVFVVFARNAAETVRPKSLSEMFGVLAHEPLAWALSAFYFLTFGGFVAVLYLSSDASSRSVRPSSGRRRFSHRWICGAGYGVPAAGGMALGPHRWIAGSFVDSPGRRRFRVAAWFPTMLPFTVGALGCAALLGIGNGAVFQLVPRSIFPTNGPPSPDWLERDGRHGWLFSAAASWRFRDHWGIVFGRDSSVLAIACLLWWLNRGCSYTRRGPGSTTAADFTRTSDRPEPARGRRSGRERWSPPLWSVHGAEF